MKKYRIVPQAENYYLIEVKNGLFGLWYYKQSALSTEDAKAAIEKFKDNEQQKEKQLLEQRRFEKENPPIYF